MQYIQYIYIYIVRSSINIEEPKLPREEGIDREKLLEREERESEGTKYIINFIYDDYR